ncbi:MAG: heme exporter protein CcmB [Chloroflexi bacterium]|nr:heme exporter protein CcmB [Chloroflexota bacterium]
MTATARKVLALYRKDLVAEARSKEVLNASLVFALLVLVLFNFALDLQGPTRLSVAPGVLWVTFTFAGVLTLGRAFAREKDRGTLEGILLAPVDPSALYVAKLLANATFMGLVEAISLPLFVALFNVELSWSAMALTTVLGTLGFAGVGTLLAAMAANTRAREVMLPILLFPLAVPVLIAAVKASAEAMVGPGGESLPWLGLLAAFDAVFLTLSVLVFEVVVEA